MPRCAGSSCSKDKSHQPHFAKEGCDSTHLPSRTSGLGTTIVIIQLAGRLTENALGAAYAIYGNGLAMPDLFGESAALYLEEALVALGCELDCAHDEAIQAYTIH